MEIHDEEIFNLLTNLFRLLYVMKILSLPHYVPRMPNCPPSSLFSKFKSNNSESQCNRVHKHAHTHTQKRKKRKEILCCNYLSYDLNERLTSTNIDKENSLWHSEMNIKNVLYIVILFLVTKNAFMHHSLLIPSLCLPLCWLYCDEQGVYITRWYLAAEY